MKFNNIINRYIFKEFIPPFLINLLFLTFVFLMTQILEITELMVNYNISFVSVLWLFVYSIPFFLQFTIPMSVMMTVLLTFINISTNNEIIAIKASGVSIYRLLPPVLLLCFIGAFLTGWMAIYGVPWGKNSFKQLVVKVAASNIGFGLKERVFNDSFKNIVLYVQEFNIKNQVIKDIFIEDRRDERAITIVMAPKGKLIREPDSLSYILRLYNGDINQVNLDDKTVQALHFNTYDISLDIKKALSAKIISKGKYEMSLGELKEYINIHNKNDRDYYAMLTMYYEKFSIPFACFVLGLIAMPLGLQSTKKTSGLNLGIIFFMLYYLLLTAGWSMCKTGVFPPMVGMWLPNIVVGITAFWFLIQTANEQPLNKFPQKIDFFKKGRL